MDSDFFSEPLTQEGFNLLREELSWSRRRIRELERELAAHGTSPLAPDQLNILSETAIGLVEMRSDADIFGYLAEKLGLLSPGTIILLSEYLPEEDALVCRSLTGVGPYLDRAISLLGGSPVGQSYPINDEFARQELLTGTLVKVVGGLYELSFGKMPKPVAKLLESLLDIGDIYGMGFCHSGVLIGNTVLVTRKGQKIDKRVVETIGAQAAVVFQRQRVERERAQIRERLERARRLEMIGKMAGGVAHYFNSLLTAIIGYSELAQVDIDAPDLLEEYLGEIRSAAERASHLTYQLLAFSRKQILEPVSAELNQIVRTFASDLPVDTSPHVDIVLDLDQAQLPVKVDVPEIKQVLANLASNSRDAMPDGGVLRIQTRLCQFDEPREFPERVLPAGHYAECVVSDTGEGMSADMVNHAFDPFFSTKPVGQGLGLGLAMVQGIIHQHGGAVTLESTPEEGTCVRFWLALDGVPAPTG